MRFATDVMWMRISWRAFIRRLNQRRTIDGDSAPGRLHRANRMNNQGATKQRMEDMMRVGFVGWRGMVGSVLMQRMIEENDFEVIDPTFFSTSSAGGKGPAIGKPTPPLGDASDVKSLAALDAIVTC